ncbi:unnamed protein product [Meganyctiphanes norvegica]|uniref:C-type lectin domain-containing protein n=1 Tax=Meganyctiphanes norvegica TaxID=48144 RepID=A0AAV2QVS3_MEGNR
MWATMRQLPFLVAVMMGLVQCNDQVEGAGHCPDLFTDVEGTCYYFSSDMGIEATWNDSLAACKELGDGLGHMNVGLAELGTSSCGCATPDIKLMETVSAKGAHVWLGASDANHDGIWIWQESQQQLHLENSMWDNIEPNGGTDENCLIATVWSGYHNRPLLNDYPCTYTWSYVCQLF